MISRIRGKLRTIGEIQVCLDVQGLGYEVLIPPAILRVVREQIALEAEMELVTFHYQQLEVGRGIPVLIGFLNEVEREFFTRFISVAGIGPKAAVKALTRPIPVIAQAIDEGNITMLRSLPGIGEQRAREIVAKLQGKVGKFALLPNKDGLPTPVDEGRERLEEEAVAILVQLEYKRAEAKQMIQAALKRNPKLTNPEELLNEVYRVQRLASEVSQVS